MSSPSKAVDVLAPGALPPVPVKVPADEFDNLVRAWGIGFCCEWFGHEYGGEFARETTRVLQERYAEAALSTIGESQ